MSVKKKKNRKIGAIIYGVCLTLWGLLLIGASAYALREVHIYAEEYEQAQPEKAMDAYVENLRQNLWNDTIAETISAMPHEVQSDEECAALVKDMLSNGITYTRMGRGDTENSLKYALKCNGRRFGMVNIDEDKSFADKVKYGALPYKVEDAEFDFNGLYASVSATVPRTYSVYLNGIRLGDEYIIEDNIPYDVLKDYYDDFPDLPTKVTYKFDHCLGPVDVEIRDEKGNIAAIDPNRDDSQYIKPCTETQLQELAEFTAKFMDRYLTYTSGTVDPNYGYQSLSPYLLKDSDLDQRMYQAMDGLSWAHTNSITIDSIKLNNAVELGDNYFLLDISTQSTTNHTGKGNVINEANMKVIAYNNNGDIRAMSLEFY